MSEQSDSSEKSHEPTARKLQRAREKGDVPKSLDLAFAAALVGMILAFATQGHSIITAIGASGVHLLSNSSRIGSWEQGGLTQAQLGDILAHQALGLAPLFLFPMVLVLGALLVQRAFVIAPDRLKPKLNKIGLWSNFKKKFGPSGLFDFGKSCLKLCLYAALFAMLFKRNLDEFATLSRLEPIIVFQKTSQLILEFMIYACVISAAIGIGDALWQQAQFIKRNRMTHKELRDEIKDSEGDPMLKQQRRQRAEEIARASALAEVPKATVLLVTPTHYAVALQWDQDGGRAPVCLAKGTDNLALAMRRRAIEAGVPIRDDPPTARALHAVMEVGAEVPRELFVPVAAAINYALAIRSKRWT